MHITERPRPPLLCLHVADLCPVRVMRFWSGEIETDGRAAKTVIAWIMPTTIVFLPSRFANVARVTRHVRLGFLGQAQLDALVIFLSHPS